MKQSLTKPVTGCIIAAVLWTIMFSPWTAPHVNFWVMMTCSGLVLTTFSTWAQRDWWKGVKLNWNNIVLGIALAAVLWGVFWIGDRLSSLMFDFARPQVNLIYGMKEGENPWVLTFLMLFIIGPAEEIFWRENWAKAIKAIEPREGMDLTPFSYFETEDINRLNNVVNNIKVSK